MAKYKIKFVSDNNGEPSFLNHVIKGVVNDDIRMTALNQQLKKNSLSFS